MKVFVTGNAGSGKSTTAKLISEQLKIPYYGLDSIVWRPGWKKTNPDVRKQQIDQLINKRSWVIDGVDKEVLKAADKVIFLDTPRSTCYRNVARRNFRFLFRSRPGLPPHCPEVLIIPRLTKIIWNFPTIIRPYILNQNNRKNNSELVHIKNYDELNHLLA